ncbi:CgeB family protein [Romboutsia lituseburensis]|uniref:CgeB family protein n=1 Tax=Romboutsia lituseburensis TaxID=1537 RepID=UPI00215AE8BF|nr:glycosyltransferase [Romboutsia lituseburensis]MCR8744699.1 glycosyltransferase [Romboutsia lituseburensis]
MNRINSEYKLSKEPDKNMNNKEIKKIEELKIACIFDPFTMSCYKGICELIILDIDKYINQLQMNKPDILLVESAWRGNNGMWTNKIYTNKRENLNDLERVISWCKENKVPTVFWNKEDPVHYEQFLNTSRLFDYIFTTDENSIMRYKQDLSNNNVYILLFAANPKIHNPIKLPNERINKACFAGTFYKYKYKERRDDLKKILDIAIENIGLDIYDRHYNTLNIGYKYTDDFKQYIKGYLDVDKLYIANKGYKIGINVNIVKNSPTMFSRRVFEYLACGTPVISTYSLGIKNIFNDLAVASDDLTELDSEFKNLQDNYYYDKKSIKGIREVLNNHTYEKRLLYILDKINIKIPKYKKKLYVISVVDTMDEFYMINNMYNNQTYKYKNILFITRNKILQVNVNEDIKKNIIVLNNENKEFKIDNLSKFNYIGILRPNNYYGKYYFEDMINATLYTDSNIIGKKSFFKFNQNQLNLVNEGKEFEYVDSIDLDKCILKTDTIQNLGLNKLIENIRLNKIKCAESVYFSIDKYNFIENIKEFKDNIFDYVEI